MIISGMDVKQVLTPTNDYRRMELPQPAIKMGEILASVLHIDRFGNVITNVTSSHLPANIDKFDVILDRGRHVFNAPLCGSYAGVEAGKPLLVIGGTGFLELSVNRGNASKIYGLRVGDTIILKY